VKSILKFDHLTQLAYSVHAPKRQQMVDSFFIKADSKGLKEVLIKCNQLLYIQAMQNYVVLHMEDNKSLSCHNSMKEMEDSLAGSCFSRIHKSYIINDEKITSVEGNMVMLSGDETNKLLIGNTYRRAFFEKKAQKMIRKKAGVQIFSYSKLASTLITFGGLLLKLQAMSELSIQF
jgi:DNA-binding LytR/AlgR family response regulator